MPTWLSVAAIACYVYLIASLFFRKRAHYDTDRTFFILPLLAVHWLAILHLDRRIDNKAGDAQREQEATQTAVEPPRPEKPKQDREYRTDDD